MILDTYQRIKNKIDVRKNLIELKAELKIGQNKSALLYHISPDYSLFEELLKDEDPKVRKNTALILGELAIPNFLEILFKAYEKEEQMFVKSSYLTAFKNMDYTSLLPQLKERLEILTNLVVDENNKKHIAEEISTISGLILAVEGRKNHEFTGYEVPSDLILLTNRNFKNITLEQLQEKNIKSKEFNAGVQVKTNDLKDILDIRTYDELLFSMEDLKTCSYDVDDVALAIANSELLNFLSYRHSGEVPFYFRIELKSKLPLDKKSAFTKKLGSEIERLTKRQLINSTSNYEFEIRLIENKDGNLNVLIKLYTLKDDRFSYRVQSIATSIAPVNAALMVSLAKKYLKEEAQILDPFCGVGTMLVERHKVVRGKTIYGLDIYAEAINKGKENAEAAGAIIHFINRDFFDFKHEYLFDEIITNMPRVLGHKLEDEIMKIYQMFFRKAPEHLKADGIMILYSHNREYIKKFLRRDLYLVEAEFEISKKEGAYLFIIRYIGAEE